MRHLRASLPCAAVCAMLATAASAATAAPSAPGPSARPTAPVSKAASLTPVSTFTFTVPLQLSNFANVNGLQVLCEVASTRVQYAPGAAGFVIAKDASGQPGRVLGEGRTALTVTGGSYSGNVVVSVPTHSPEDAANAHFYGCALIDGGGVMTNKKDANGHWLLDQASFHPVAQGAIQ